MQRLNKKYGWVNPACVALCTVTRAMWQSDVKWLRRLLPHVPWDQHWGIQHVRACASTAPRPQPKEDFTVWLVRGFPSLLPVQNEHSFQEGVGFQENRIQGPHYSEPRQV